MAVSAVDPPSAMLVAVAAPSVGVTNVGLVVAASAPEPLRVAVKAVPTFDPRPVMPPTGTAAAVMLVLQPKPVFVVQITALAAVEHDPIASAAGDAVPDVALPTIVFVA